MQRIGFEFKHTGPAWADRVLLLQRTTADCPISVQQACTCASHNICHVMPADGEPKPHCTHAENAHQLTRPRFMTQPARLRISTFQSQPQAQAQAQPLILQQGSQAGVVRNASPDHLARGAAFCVATLQAHLTTSACWALRSQVCKRAACHTATSGY